MSKTNDLRKLIQSQLMTLKNEYSISNVYYRVADEGALFNHIVYDFDSIMSDLNRGDYTLNIDIYGKDSKITEDIADAVEKIFHVSNLPQQNILPTFFLEQRRNVMDEDRSVRHILLRFTIQNYER